MKKPKKPSKPPMDIASTSKKLNPIDFHSKFFSQGIRSDGRAFSTVRRTMIVLGTLASQEGSAMCKIGQTSVVCGIRAEVGVPPVEDPNRGKVGVSRTVGICPKGFGLNWNWIELELN